jgi:ABC-2 type transport system ATP-binding protein
MPVMSGGNGGPVLRVEGARRSYGERIALGGVDLTLRPGEIYALLGPNGAGKTSLIRAVCGRVRLDAGSVRLGDADPSRDPRARRRLGLVPQEVALYPDLTVRENLEVLGRLAGLDAAAVPAAVEAALAWTGLRERKDSRVATLSGGMQRRVNLAAGALHSPTVLLLDEPTVGVDPQARERIHDLLRDLRGRGTAILLATHDLDQASELADRIGILVDGKLRAEGPLERLAAEAFRGARELTVRLASDADPATRASLSAEGLQSSADGRSWTGPLEGGLEAMTATGRRLADGGVPISEIRLREPGLRAVFFRVAGREFDA